MSRILPILFNTEMVQDVLREISPKTATRRSIKRFIPDDAIWGYTMFTPKGYISCRGTFKDGYGEKFYKLPCEPGDILYVRETWNFIYEMDGNDRLIEDTGCYVYYADDTMPCSHWVDSETGKHKDHMPWRPSIHMPKEAARIWLKVTDVRVERLKTMNLGDFLAEGAVIRPEAFNDPDNAYLQARDVFVKIWDRTIKKSDIGLYNWDANPWVWVIEFERCEKPEAL